MSPFFRIAWLRQLTAAVLCPFIAFGQPLAAVAAQTQLEASRVARPALPSNPAIAGGTDRPEPPSTRRILGAPAMASAYRSAFPVSVEGMSVDGRPSDVLLDRDPMTRPVADYGFLTMNCELGTERAVTAVALYGADAGTLQQIDEEGRALGQPVQVPESTDAWRQVALTTRPLNSLRLEWTSTGDAPSELAVLAAEASVGVHVATTVPEQIHLGTLPGGVEHRAAPRSATIDPERGGAVFEWDLDGVDLDPARVFLVYELTGVSSWASPRKVDS